MSPRSTGRPPGRGQRHPQARRSAGRISPRRVTHPGWNEPVPGAGETTGYWFDDPLPGDRRSWAAPPGHGRYQGLDLELLDPADEDERVVLLEALHPECEDALRGDGERVVDGEPFNPRLHISLHQVVANQLLAGNPPQTWQAVQRLAGLGYDWHNIMHMIARLVSDDIYQATTEQKPFGLRDYVQRLSELPGDWPPPPAGPN
jgi:hypothetical protein